MKIDLASMTVPEIERWVRSRECTPALLARLRRDPRRGVQRLYRIQRKRLARELQEQKRLQRLLSLELVLWKAGVRHVAGVDEVGIGPLAGPVVAAAVIFPPEISIQGIDDSKRIPPQLREELAAEIRKRALAIGIGLAQVEEIDRFNVYQAGLLAMRRAVENLSVPPQHLLIDARELPELEIPQNRFEKGDGINFSIAAASILAKTYRDQLMSEADALFPQYGFRQHKGYGTPEHCKALRRYGPCPLHRRSFAVVSELCGGFSEDFYRLRRECLQRGNQGLKSLALQIRSHARLKPEERRRLLALCRRRAGS